MLDQSNESLSLSSLSSLSVEYEFPSPIWAEPMKWDEQELQIFLSQGIDLSNQRSEILYQGVRKFSQKHQVCFEVCSVFALDLYFRNKFDVADVEKHLLEKIDVVRSSSPQAKNGLKVLKTVLLTGRSGEGKSTLTNQIIGRDVARVGNACKSVTTSPNLYISDSRRLSVVDTPGLDATWKHTTESSPQDMMNNIVEQTMFYLEIGASIDAIIIVWCPIRNANSNLSKIIKTLKKSCGDSITESCIIMIQGNWRKDPDLANQVPKARKEIEKEFPEIPIHEYDVKGSADEQLPPLLEKIEKVSPYRVKAFHQKQMELFFQMVQAFKVRVEQLPEKERKDFCQNFQADVFQKLQNKGETVKLKKKWLKGVRQALIGVVGTGTGVITVAVALKCLGVGAVAAGGASMAGFGFLGVACAVVFSGVFRSLFPQSRQQR